MHPVYLSAEIHSINLSNTNPLILPGIIGGRHTQILIDSGASLTLINSQFFKKLPTYYQRRARPPPPNLFLQLADRSHLQVKCSLTLPITISNSTRTHTVYVVPQLWRSCIIGNDLIRKHNLQIDGGRQYAYFKKYNQNKPPRQTGEENIHNDEEYTLLSIERIKLPPFHAYHIRVKPNKMFKSSNETNDEAEYEITSIKETPRVANGIITPQHDMIIQLANLTERTIMIHTNQPLAKMTRLNQNQLNMIQYGQSNTANISTELSPEETTNLINTDLNEDQKIKLKQLIKKFPTVFNEQAGRTTKLQHHINLTPGSQPYNSPPYRYAPARRQIIEENLKEMTEQGIISPSKSPWASPVVLAPKKRWEPKILHRLPKIKFNDNTRCLSNSKNRRYFRFITRSKIYINTRFTLRLLASGNG